MRGHTITASQTLITETCCDCGVLFALTDEMQARLRKSHAWFYCPSGHSQQYVDKTKDEKRIVELEMRVANLADDFRVQRGKATEATRKNKRVANGVCPCCNRSFVQLTRHIKGQHPDFVPA